MIEKDEKIQQDAEEISVSIEEQSATPDDQVELDRYTKGVSKRINKKNQQLRQAEERANALEQMVREQQTQLHALSQSQVEQQATVLQKEEEALLAKETQANDLYKKAVESGDAELMTKADTLKSDLSIQKEKIRLAKNRQESVQQQPVSGQAQPYSQQPASAQQQSELDRPAEPTKEALGWYEQNKWYGDQEDPSNLEATQFAFFQHNMLINEGYEPDSNEYYGELNNRIYKIYPHLQSADEGDGQKEDRPSVQRVASASVGSRPQTRGKKNGVTFTKTEVERLRGLKPHNMSEQDWLKRVAQEKQKIAQREAV